MPLDSKATGKTREGRPREPLGPGGLPQAPKPGARPGGTRLGQQQGERLILWRHKKLLLLVALLATWVVTYSFYRPAHAPAPSPAPSERAPAVKASSVPRLKTELLQRETPTYTPERQNIFGTPPPPPPPPRPPVTAAAAQPAAPPPPPPPDPFQVEAAGLRYVGYLDARPRLTAFIMQGTDLYTVEAGATISGRFRVQTITEDAALISSLSGDKQVRLSLVGTAPMAGITPAQVGAPASGGVKPSAYQQVLQRPGG